MGFATMDLREGCFEFVVLYFKTMYKLSQKLLISVTNMNIVSGKGKGKLLLFLQSRKLTMYKRLRSV